MIIVLFFCFVCFLYPRLDVRKKGIFENLSKVKKKLRKALKENGIVEINMQRRENEGLLSESARFSKV